MSKSNVVRFKSWSPSRMDDYDRCPLFAKLKHLDKLCTLCFKGAIKGGYDSPAVCDTCHGTIVKGEAMVRGGIIGDALDRHLLGGTKMPTEIKHSKVKEIIKKAKAEIKKGIGRVQVNLKLDRKWRVIPGAGWSPAAWLFAKLDYQRVQGSLAHVTDWKTGGCEKRGPQIGKVKVVDKYDFQLDTYNVVTLVSQPEVEGVTSNLVFLDCQPPHNPVVERNGLARKDLPKAIKAIEKKVLPLFNDDTYAPKCSYLCGYCDYSKSKGGPCAY